MCFAVDIILPTTAKVVSAFKAKDFELLDLPFLFNSQDSVFLGERVVVLNHYPIAPENPHNLWDEPEIIGFSHRVTRTSH